MKLRSYFTLVLLFSAVTPTIIMHADDQEHRNRAGSVVEVHSVQELNAIIANNERVVVDFYAPWCGPCKRMSPEFAKLPAAFPDTVFVKISVDLSGVSGTFGIKSMPTLIFYKNGQRVSSFAGFKSFIDLKNYVINTFGA